MKELNQDKVPATISEAITDILRALEPADLAEIRSMNPSAAHFGLGMHIRNTWSLWEEDTPLKRDFREKYELWGHADDVSAVILEGVWATVKGKNVEEAMASQAKRSFNHWKQFNTDPKTGKQLL